MNVWTPCFIILGKKKKKSNFLNKIPNEGKIVISYIQGQIRSFNMTSKIWKLTQNKIHVKIGYHRI